MIFETERLIARAWREDDVEEAFRMYGDPEVTRWIGGHTEQDLEAMRGRMDFVIKRNAGLPEGLGSFATISKATGEMVGTALIKPLPDPEGEPTTDIEVGWHLIRANWGQGYATEAGRALLHHGFETLGIERLHAVVDPPNTASQRVAGRLGMEHVGQTTAYYEGRAIEHFVLDRLVWRDRRETRA